MNQNRAFNWRHIPLIIVAVYALAPIALLFLNSFKANTDIAMNPLGIPHHWTLENFIQAWQVGDIGRAYFNTFVVALVTVILQCCVSGLAAYALSHLKPRGSGAFTGYLFLSMSLPVGFVPLFFIDVKLGLINNYFGLIIPYVGGGFAFNVFLLRAFMLGIPKELLEVAKVDGCGVWSAFLRIVVPLSKAAFLVVALFSTLGAWNEILLSSAVLQSQQWQTLAVSYLTFKGQYATNWSLMAAAGVMTVIPMIVLFLFMTRRFISGVQEGGLKF